MLSTLAVGLAAGVGQYAMAVFATAFVVITLWILESLEPEPYALFELKISSKDTSAIRERIEQSLRRQRVRFELRSTSLEDISYEVKLPLGRKTDAISESFAAISPKQSIEVKWDKKKEK